MNRHLILLAVLAAACASTKQPAFGTAEEAARELVEALRAEDLPRAEAILGEGGEEILYSGDDVADRNGRKEFVRLYDEKHRMEKRPDGAMTLCIGEIDWPVPAPLVRSSDQWVFDGVAGQEEILDRRIGKNELDAAQVCLAYCDAQREYALRDRDGDGVLEYARKFRSSPGAQDGLFWHAKEGEPQSPLGEFAAQAVKEGYRGGSEGEGPRPYHGYYYRILESQGPNAQGGEHTYLAGDSMIGGFALVAYPAEYGNSGIMTFVVSYEGTVYEKDLGDDTEKTAEEMTVFDPDPSWKPVPE